MTVEAAQQCTKDRKSRVESPGVHVDDCVSLGHFCLVPVFFWSALPRSGGLSPGEG